jgi:hypothetical protein
MAISILIANVLAIGIIIFSLLIFIRKTVLPIKEATDNIISAIDNNNII